MSTLEERYLSGEVDFETAVSIAVGMPVGRESIVPLLRAMHVAGDLRPAAEIGDQDAALYDRAGFIEDPVAPVVMAGARESRMRELIATALTVEQAAARLGVSSSRIRQRIGAR